MARYGFMPLRRGASLEDRSHRSLRADITAAAVAVAARDGGRDHRDSSFAAQRAQEAQ